MLRHRSRAAAAIVLGLAVLGYAAHRHAARQEAPAAAPVAVAPGTDVAPAAGPSGRKLRVGMARTYALDLTHATTLGGGGAAGVDLHVTAELTLACAEPSGTRTRFRAVLRAPRLGFGAQGGALDPARAGAVEADLARPFYVTVEADGRLAEVHVARGSSSLARGVQRSLAATLQVLDRPGAAWSADEVDLTGEYRADYRRGDDPRALVKTKAAYTRLATPRGLEAPGPGASVTVSGATTIAVDDDGWIRTFDAHEEIAVQPGRGMPGARSTGRTSLRATSSADDPSAALGFTRDLAGLERAEAADAADEVLAQRRADELLVRGASFEALREATRTGEASARAEGQARLAALLRLDPSLAGRAGAELARSTGEDAESLVGALGEAGHPEAQRALAAVLEDAKAPADVRASAAMALGLARAPTHETATSLERATADRDSDVARTATLGMGTVARNLAGSSPEVAGGAVDALLGRLEGAKESDETVILLRALGNAGDPRVVPLAERAYGSDDPLVRRAAVTSVRLVAGAPPDALIARAMTGDADEDVREEALDAAQVRGPEAQLASVGAVLAHDGVEKVRLEAVRTLVRYSDRAPEDTARLLRGASQNDPSPDVRELASRALGG